MSAIFRPSLINRFFAMSSTDVFSKLSSPLRELVAGSAQQDSQQLGVSEKDQTDIAQWIQKAAQADTVKPDALPVCHKLWNSTLFYQHCPVTRYPPGAAHIPRQQLSDSRRRRCLRSVATHIRTSPDP